MNGVTPDAGAGGPGHRERLGGLDSAFLSLGAGTVPLQVGMLVTMGPPDGRRALFSAAARSVQLRRLFERRIHRVPVLRQRLRRVPFGLGHPWWEDDAAFSLDNHFVRLALPEPGGRGELDELVADRMSRPFDPGHPLWEVGCIEGLEGGETALLLRVHHAVLDGVSGTALLAAILDLQPRAPVEEVFPPPFVPDPSPGLDRVVGHALRSLARWPATVLRSAERTVLSAADVAERNRRRDPDGPPPPPSPFSAPRLSCNGSISASRRFTVALVPMDQVDHIRRTTGARVHEIVLTAAAGGVRRVLEGRGEEVPERLVAMVPISLRHDLGEARPGNQVSGMLVGLRAGSAEPLVALADTVAAARESREQATVLEDRVVGDLAEAALPALAAGLAAAAAGVRLFDRMAPLANLSVSGLRGPEAGLYSAGAPVRSLVPIGPVADGVGVNLTALSYNGTLAVGILSCSALLADPGELARGFEDTVAALHACCRPGAGNNSGAHSSRPVHIADTVAK